jgi:hypothetical protein
MMSRKIVIAVAWGLAGLAIVAGLTLGAFALAGEDLSKPAVPVVEPVDEHSPGPDSDDRTASPSPDRSHSPSPSPSVDDHGGANGTGDDHGGASSSGSDDHPGSGSGSDSGSGSGGDD